MDCNSDLRYDMYVSGSRVVGPPPPKGRGRWVSGGEAGRDGRTTDPQFRRGGEGDSMDNIHGYYPWMISMDDIHG